MASTLSLLMQNAGKQKIKEIMLFLVAELKIPHNKQWTTNRLYKHIVETGTTETTIKNLLSPKYQLQYFLSKYNKFTTHDLRKIVSKRINNKGWGKEELVKYLVDNNIEEEIEVLSELQKKLGELGRNRIRILARHYGIEQKINGKNVLVEKLINQIERQMIANNITFETVNDIAKKLDKKKNYEKAIVSNKIQKIINHKEPIQYVIHLADLHIPQKLRYNEYKEVFDNLINKINMQKLHGKTIVVVCGDIFHTKVYQRSNSIILWNYLVKEITKLYPMFVITGNHDYDMTSNDNDWIASTYATDNFYHLNQCGEYVINNISLGVSPLNSAQVYKMEQSDRTRIQLYHGALKGCQMFNGTTLDEGISMDDFGEYDYLMLGDIHKMQFLKETTAYSGSLVQQNFGESIDNHGFIIWDILNKTKQFCEIENKHAFLTVHISSAGYKFDERILDMNKTDISLRLEMYDNNSGAIDEFKEFAQQQNWNIIKTKINKHYITSKSLTGAVKIDEDICINEYFVKKGNNDKLSDGIIKNLCDLHDEIEQSVNIKENLVSQWKINTIEFKNLFCFGGERLNNLNLGEQGIYKIFANNFMGKSSILKVVKWALFQDTSGIKDFDVLHKSSDIEAGFVHIGLQSLHSDERYVLERNIIRDNKLKSTIRVEHKLSYGEKVIVGKENVNSIIRDIVGTYEEFELVASVNNTDLGILHKNASTVFTQLFNLQKFSEYDQYAKEQISNARSDIKALQRDADNITAVPVEEIEQIGGQIQQLEDEVKSLQIMDLSNLIKQKQELFDKYRSIEMIREMPCEECTEEISEIDIKKLHEMAERKEKLRASIRNVKIINDTVIQKNLNRYNLEIEELKTNIVELNEKLESSRQAINKFNQQKSNIKYSDIELYAMIKAQEHDYVKTKNIIIDKLDAGTVGDEDYNAIRFLITEQNYHAMMDELEQNKTIDKKINELEVQIRENTTTMDTAMKRYNEVTHKRYRLEIMLKENEANKIIQAKNIDFEKEIELITHNLTDMNKIENQNRDIREKRKAYQQYLLAVAHNNKHRTERNDLEILLKNCEKELEDKTKQNNSVITKQVQLSSEIDKLRASYDSKVNNNLQLDEINKKLLDRIEFVELYSLYRGFVQEHGIPNMILFDKLPMIENDVNQVLSRYTNFKILVEFTGKRKSIEIYQMKSSEKISLGSLSGYETLITNIAFKVAIKQNCNLHSPNFIMIDEVLSSVSAENYEKLPELFELLESYYEIIFLITHIRDIKEMCEGSGVDITLCRDGGVSWIK